MTVAEVFASANLSPHGPVRWKAPIRESSRGVYVVAESAILTAVVERVSRRSKNRDCLASKSILTPNIAAGLEANPSFTSARQIKRYKNVSGSSTSRTAGKEAHMLAVRRSCCWTAISGLIGRRHPARVIPNGRCFVPLRSRRVMHRSETSAESVAGREFDA